MVQDNIVSIVLAFLSSITFLASGYMDKDATTISVALAAGAAGIAKNKSE